MDLCIRIGDSVVDITQIRKVQRTSVCVLEVATVFGTLYHVSVEGHLVEQELNRLQKAWNAWKIMTTPELAHLRAQASLNKENQEAWPKRRKGDDEEHSLSADVASLLSSVEDHFKNGVWRSAIHESVFNLQYDRYADKLKALGGAPASKSTFCPANAPTADTDEKEPAPAAQ
jgi:hypothetical protein